jgi:predicted nucleotide-binding protein
MKQRVRQNVLFEYGLCVGKLRRENVCPILRGEVEIPTDILGAVYIPFRDKVSECKDKIRQELEATGYKIPYD